MCQIQMKLDYVVAVADWLLAAGEAHINRGELEDGLKYTHLAASILCRQNRDLSSVGVELNLQSAARRILESDGLEHATRAKAGAKKVCLHVMDQALPLGGVSAMAARWMRNDQVNRINSLALLSQEIPVPEELLQATSQSGGTIYKANPKDSFVRRAAWLRNLAYNVADCVVLHVDVSDVMCGAAFGINGGPPVLLVNHTAHLYWAGASVVDLLLNCRGSALEGVWASTHRGIPRYANVPIPLLEMQASNGGSAADAAKKHEAKRAAGVPENATVILTVGASFKYLPANGLDFVEVCVGILQELPDAYVLVVGTPEDDRWKSASDRTGSRLRALGTMPQSRLAAIREAADVYIEGFPFGTTTSLLEAGLAGIPVVLAPAQCPPPYGTDGIALDDTLERPPTVEEYKNRIIHLIKNPDDRAKDGETIRNSVVRHHTGVGWRQHLEDALNSLPREHSFHAVSTMVRTPAVIHEYWAGFLTKLGSGYELALENSITQALSMGLQPRLTKEVRRACKKAVTLRRGSAIPLPLLILLCNWLLPCLPIVWAGKCFRAVAFSFRGHLLRRVFRKAGSLFRSAEKPKLPYQEYRHVHSNPKASAIQGVRP